MNMEDNTRKQQETPNVETWHAASLQEWLENNEIDHPDYPEKFAEFKRLEEADDND